MVVFSPLVRSFHPFPFFSVLSFAPFSYFQKIGVFGVVLFLFFPTMLYHIFLCEKKLGGEGRATEDECEGRGRGESDGLQGGLRGGEGD